MKIFNKILTLCAQESRLQLQDHTYMWKRPVKLAFTAVCFQAKQPKNRPQLVTEHLTSFYLTVTPQVGQVHRQNGMSLLSCPPRLTRNPQQHLKPSPRMQGATCSSSLEEVSYWKISWKEILRLEEVNKNSSFLNKHLSTPALVITVRQKPLEDGYMWSYTGWWWLDLDTYDQNIWHYHSRSARKPAGEWGLSWELSITR